MAKIEVEKICIRVGMKVLELTPEELRELKDILEKTFPSPKTVYVPGQPIIVERPAWGRSHYKHWFEPTWDRNTATMVLTHHHHHDYRPTEQTQEKPFYTSSM